MRVTANMSADLSVYNIQQGRSRIDKIVEKLTSSQMINRPSDDPVSSGTLLDIKNKNRAYEQFGVNITKCKSWLDVTSNGLTGISDVLNAVRTMTTGNTALSIQDPTERQAAHDQLVELKRQLIEMGNVQFGDQYIFGGGNNLVPPFSQETGKLTSGQSGVSMTPADTAALANGMSVSGIGIPSGSFIKNLNKVKSAEEVAKEVALAAEKAAADEAASAKRKEEEERQKLTMEA
jgi:flagellar hook-associated protein 3 FlgL